MFKKTMLLIGLSLFSLSSAQQQISEQQLQEEKQRLKKEIADVDRKIGRTDSLTSVEQKRFQQLKKQTQNKIDTKKKNIADLKTKLNDLNKEISRLSGRIEQTDSRGKALENRRSYLSKQLIEQCNMLEAEIKRGLPWDKEKRLSRVSALKRDLQSGAARIEDGFSRLKALVDEEIAFGDDIVLKTRTVKRNNGSTVNARTLRIGNLWMVYVDDSEELYGVLSQKDDSTYAWKEDLSFSQREDIRTAIKVKEAKKAPQIITLPLELSINQEEVN